MAKREITCEIIARLGVLSTSSKGWTKEINIISWNGAAPKFDIREWPPEHDHGGRGITLTEEEMEVLKKIMVE